MMSGKRMNKGKSRSKDFEGPSAAKIPVVESVGHTRTEIVKLSFRWTIHNFSFRWEKEGEFFYSPTFSGGFLEDEGQPKWRLRMYPRGEKKEVEDHVGLRLMLDESFTKSEVLAKFKCAILKANGEEMVALACSEPKRFHLGQGWGNAKVIKRDTLSADANTLMPNDKLTILCEIMTVGDSVNTSGKSSTAVQLKALDDLGNLLESGRLSDVTLIVAGKEFQVHKAMLAARSTVFAAMFEHEMEESKQNRVEITDMEADVMEEMLKFIYAGKSDNLGKMSKGLLAAADKYALEGLKTLCEDALCEALSVENAAEVLAFADLYSAKNLKDRAVAFICKHATKVMDSKRWKSMVTFHPHLLSEVCRALATRQIGEDTTSTPSASKRIKVSRVSESSTDSSSSSS